MSLFQLSRACRTSCGSFPAYFEEMRGEVTKLYEMHRVVATPQLDLECAFFLHWCMEIGLYNARAGTIDRWWAHAWLRKSLRLMTRRLPLPTEALVDDPVASYRQRYREALFRIRNIYVRRIRGGGLEMPLTPRLSRLFLRNTAAPVATPAGALEEEAHRLLTGICRRHVLQVMSGAA